jgi:sugar/nucleoside kinase (ribokinase family)
MHGIWRILNDAASHVVVKLLAAALLAILTVLRVRLIHINPRIPGRKLEGAEPSTVRAAEKRVDVKLSALCSQSDHSFAMIGNIYMDVLVRPISTRALHRGEWSNIDPISVELGGSAYWVGHYLYKYYAQRSYLFTAMGGSEDIFSREGWDRLQDEPWPLNKQQLRPDKARTAVSVHLTQEDGGFTTIFTHRGALVQFGWSSIEDELQHVLEDGHGGVLYISGYLRNNLCEDLLRILRSLAQDTLICIDHGQLVAKMESPGAVYALRDAFARQLIDIYICSYDELCSLLEFPKRPSSRRWPSPDPVRILTRVAKRHILPIVTIVRGGVKLGGAQAYAMVGEHVSPISADGGSLNNSSVGSRNAFNATLLYALSHARPMGRLEDRVLLAVKEALERWAAS